MIQLFKHNPQRLETIAEEYYNRIISKQKGKKKYMWALLDYIDKQLNNNIAYCFFKTYKDNLKNIILLKPYEMYDWIDYFESTLSPSNKIEVQKFFENYYQDYDRWGAYELAHKLGIDVCPYCNQSYTYTIGDDDNKSIRPEYDHFFCKSKYPYLALSFYNLIPSCHICNSNLKGSKEFKLHTHVHPYQEGFGNYAKVKSKPKTYEAFWGLDEENMDVFIEIEDFNLERKTRIEGNLEVFKLKDRYKMHKNIVSEMYVKKQISSDKYIDVLINTFPDAKLTKEEAYRLAFGNYISEENFHKRPLSKLTHDIAEDLGLI